MNETYEAREGEPWDQATDLIALQQEVEQGNERVKVETVEGKTIKLSFLDMLKGVGKGFTQYESEKSEFFDGYHIQATALSKSYQNSDQEIYFNSINHNKITTCIIRTGTPIIQKIQYFLSNLNPSLYSGPKDSKITTQLRQGIWEYINQYGWTPFTFYYKNSSGEGRFFHRPKPTYLLYSLGVTMCPYNSPEEIFTHTTQPSSIGSSDFYCNYINTKTRGDNLITLTDKNTGNSYYQAVKQEVPIDGLNHFNIQRFLIEPHYKNVLLSKKQAKINALYDLFKYYLIVHKGDRKLAQQATLQLMKSYIEPIVNGKVEERSHKYFAVYKYGYTEPVTYPKDENYCTPFNLFRSDLDDNLFLDKLLSYSHEHKQTAPSDKETATFLTHYHIYFRNKSPEEAKSILQQLCDKYVVRYQNEIIDIKDHTDTSQANKDKYIGIAEGKLIHVKHILDLITK